MFNVHKVNLLWIPLRSSLIWRCQRPIRQHTFTRNYSNGRCHWRHIMRCDCKWVPVSLLVCYSCRDKLLNSSSCRSLLFSALKSLPPRVTYDTQFQTRLRERSRDHRHPNSARRQVTQYWCQKRARESTRRTSSAFKVGFVMLHRFGPFNSALS